MKSAYLSTGAAAALLLSCALFAGSAAAFWGGPAGFGPPMPGFAPGYGYPSAPVMPGYAPRPWGNRGYGWRPPRYAPAWRPAPVYQQSRKAKPVMPGLCR